MTGVSDAGLTTTAFPSAIAGATERLLRCKRKVPRADHADDADRLAVDATLLAGMSVASHHALGADGNDDASSVTARAMFHSSSALIRVLPDS